MKGEYGRCVNTFVFNTNEFQFFFIFLEKVINNYQFMSFLYIIHQNINAKRNIERIWMTQDSSLTYFLVVKLNVSFSLIIISVMYLIFFIIILFIKLGEIIYFVIEKKNLSALLFEKKGSFSVLFNRSNSRFMDNIKNHFITII